MRHRYLICILLVAVSVCPALAKGKLAGSTGGNERGAVVYSEENGLERWTITGPTGNFEFTLDPGEYMVSVNGRLAPYVRVREGETTRIYYASQSRISMESELWTPSGKSFGQTYTATGTALTGVGFWMPGGSTKMRVSLREEGPDGKLIGEYLTEDRHTWITSIHVPAEDFPTTRGDVYYLEIESAEDLEWAIATPRLPDVYPGGMAFYDRVPRPESDLGITIHEQNPGLITVAAAREGHDFIASGPGSGNCTVAGQSFVANEAGNIISVYVNCGFHGITDFIYTIREGGMDGEIIASKTARMVANWGSTVYFQPHEVVLKPGQEYFLEYKRVDGEPFYSYLSSKVYPHGKAYRDGQEVEGFDHYFHIVGEIEPGGLTYPYNIRASNVTPVSATISWETGTKADGIVNYGLDRTVRESIVASDDLRNEHVITLDDLQPGTTYYYQVSSYTNKRSASRAYGHISSFMTLPVSEDRPQFDTPEPPSPVEAPGDRNLPVANGSFENGIEGWQVSWYSDPREVPEDFTMPEGPYGSVTSGIDGYRPRSGEKMYGWGLQRIDEPHMPGEVWKQDIVYQSISVEPGKQYVLRAWLITGDRGSGWGGDSRARLVVDTKDAGFLGDVKTANGALATQWFATHNQWTPISMHFTAEKDTVAIGVHFFQWFFNEAGYLFADDITVEKVD